MLRSTRIALLAAFALWEYGCTAFQIGSFFNVHSLCKEDTSLKAMDNVQQMQQNEQYKLQPEAAMTILQILQRRISDGAPLEPHALNDYSSALERLVEEIPQPVAMVPPPTQAQAPTTSLPAFLDQMPTEDELSPMPQGANKKKEEVILPEGAVSYDFGSTEIYMMEKGDISPIGGTIWEGGLILASYLKDMEWEYFGWLSGKRFIDLGSGTGICGIMAWKFGAEGIMTDQNRVSEDGTSLFDLIEENIHLNLKDATQIGEDKDQTLARAQVSELTWGQPVPAKVKDFVSKGPLNYIFCGDTLYQKSAHPALLQTIKDLAGPETAVFVAYPDRGNQEDGFARRLEHYGFNVDYIIDDPKNKVYMYAAKLREN